MDFFLFEYLLFSAEQSGGNYKVGLYAYLPTEKLVFIVAESNFKWHFLTKLCVVDGFYEVLLESGVKPPSQPFLV